MLHHSARREAGVKLLAQARDAARIAETLLSEAKAAVRQRVHRARLMLRGYLNAVAGGRA